MSFLIVKNDPVEITVNRSYKDFISEKELVQIIKEMKKPETERIYVLFL